MRDGVGRVRDAGDSVSAEQSSAAPRPHAVVLEHEHGFGGFGDHSPCKVLYVPCLPCVCAIFFHVENKKRHHPAVFFFVLQRLLYFSRQTTSSHPWLLPFVSATQRHNMHPGPYIGRVAAHNLGLLAKEVEPEFVTKDLLELFTGESSRRRLRLAHEAFVSA